MRLLGSRNSFVSPERDGGRVKKTLRLPEPGETVQQVMERLFKMRGVRGLIDAPGYAKCLEIRNENGVPVIYDEFVEADSLADFLSEMDDARLRVGELPGEARLPRGRRTRVQVCLQMIDRIETLQRHRVVWGDFKVENCVWIPGWGLVLVDGETAAMDGDCISQPVGTPPHVAPEQAEGTVALTSDNPAFATAIFRVLTGLDVRPRQGASAVLADEGLDPVVWAAKLEAVGLDRGFAEVLKNFRRLNIHDRGDFEALRQGLFRYQAGLPMAGRSWIAAAATLLVGLGAAAGIWSHYPRQPVEIVDFGGGDTGYLDAIALVDGAPELTDPACVTGGYGLECVSLTEPEAEKPERKPGLQARQLPTAHNVNDVVVRCGDLGVPGAAHFGRGAAAAVYRVGREWWVVIEGARSRQIRVAPDGVLQVPATYRCTD
jgi:hypothetical protein